MRGRLVVAVITLLVGCGAGAGWLVYAQAKTVPPPKLATINLGSIEETVSAVGSLAPRAYVDVGTQVSGQLRLIHVEIGDRVERGQLLAEIDPTVYETRVAADNAQVLMLKAQMREKRVQLDLAEKQFERQRQLRATRTASAEAYDTADATRQQYGAQIDALEANIRQVEATLKADQANLGYTRIHAPMSGTVIDINALQGQTLNANQQAPIILRIANLDTMTVETEVSEADVSRLRIGMTARFTTLGQPDRVRVGTLRQILPTPEVTNNVVLYKCLFDVANPDLDLLPTMSAQVNFLVGEAKAVPLAPLSAMRKVGRDRYVVRVMENGVPVEREVTVAAGDRIMAAVRDGLSVGDQVVIETHADAPKRGRDAGGPPPPPGMGGPRL